MKLTAFLDSINKIKLPILQDGKEKTIDDFFNNCLKGHLPKYNTICAWDKLLNRYVDEEKAIFFIRKHANDSRKNWNNIRRGFYTKYNNNFGYVYCDNFFAHYFYVMAVNNYVPDYNDFYSTIMERKFPYGFMETVEEIPFRAFGKGKNVRINKSGWKLAHIFSVNGNDYNFNYKLLSKNLFPLGLQEEWVKHNNSDYPYKKINKDIEACERNIMKAHFLRLVHPINYFLVPNPKHISDCISKDIGEYPELINYMYLKNKCTYSKIFDNYKNNILVKNTYIIHTIEKLGNTKIDIKYGFSQNTKKQNVIIKSNLILKNNGKDNTIYQKILLDNDNEEYLIVKAYLVQGMSYRNIEKTIYDIDSPTRGGGYLAMNKLHELGITGDKKGSLKYKTIDEEIKNANGKYLETLLKHRYKLQKSNS